MSIPKDEHAAERHMCLTEEQVAKLEALRTKLNASIAAGGDCSNEDIDVALEEVLEELRREGFQ